MVKITWTDFAISFLEHEDFETAAPLLRASVRVCLAAGKVRRTAFADHLNRPILHRKETLLPPAHVDVPKPRSSDLNLTRWQDPKNQHFCRVGNPKTKTFRSTCILVVALPIFHSV